MPPQFNILTILRDGAVAEQSLKLQKYSAPALEKGLEILEYLSLTDRNPTLSQLAVGIGRSKSEIFRMVIVLEERGFIAKNEGDTFELTDKLTTLGTERSDNSRLAEVSKPYLISLADKTGLSNYISVFDEKSLLVIAEYSAPQSYGLSVQVGYRAPLVRTSAGTCFLRDFVSCFDQRTHQSRFDGIADEAAWYDIDSAAEKLNIDGYVVAQNADAHSILELSAPVISTSKKQTIAAITIPYLATQETTNRFPEIADSLLSASAALKEKLAITMPSIGRNALLA